MPIEIIQPLSDKRWHEFLREQPDASVFHSQGWLKALQQTYGYEPLTVGMVNSDGRILDAIVFCMVRSRITGNRLVSMPFSDHCEPLVSSSTVLAALLAYIPTSTLNVSCKYTELRPINALCEPPSKWQQVQKYILHTISIDAPLTIVKSKMHKDCVQRKIRRAEREGLEYRSGRSDEMIQQFYCLLIQTRRRHSVFPQPIEWFTNLAASFGDAFTIHLAYSADKPIAAINTLAYKDTLVYKYGASDERFHQLGGIPYLFWHAIVKAKAAGFRRLDLGRTDLDAAGLIDFKNHLGASQSEISYWRKYDNMDHNRSYKLQFPFRKQICQIAPDSLLVAAGRILYKHCG